MEEATVNEADLPTRIDTRMPASAAAVSETYVHTTPFLTRIPRAGVAPRQSTKFPVVALDTIAARPDRFIHVSRTGRAFDPPPRDSGPTDADGAHTLAVAPFMSDHVFIGLPRVIRDARSPWLIAWK